MRAALLVVVVVGCAHRVPQDGHTGRDGHVEGARVMQQHGRTWVARGIVTYPGGDRVDWYRVRVPPATARANVALVVTRTPRPELRVYLDVFDEWHHRLSRHPARRGRDKHHIEVIAPHGELLVRVYAPRRGDAGAYELRVELTPSPITNPPSAFTDVPPPPDLPAVPELEPLDCTTFGSRVPCGCPPGAPPGWPGCPQERCPTPPDPSIKACQATMPCPTPPDPRVKACKRS
ncbi:MAG: hypothetical protein ABI867_43175 [Kofleriaceae bacterium]